MDYITLIERLFDNFEAQRLSEDEILERSQNLVKCHKDDKEYLYTLNDTLYNRGYAFQFAIKNDKPKFDGDVYESLTGNVTKSKAKTQALIDYLAQLSNHILTLASMYLLKVRHLIDLGYLPDDNDTINAQANLTLQDLLFENYFDKAVKHAVQEALARMGIPDIYGGYNEFRLDVEYLLWTIDKSKGAGYMKINTVKVALNIAPRQFFEREGKPYYYPSTAKEAKKFIKLIDGDAVAKIKARWGESGYETISDGYKLLYQYL